jgi:hypothetical protein
MSEANYYVERARQEAALASQADHPKAAAAHRTLSLRYSTRAVISIAGEKDCPKENAVSRARYDREKLKEAQS